MRFRGSQAALVGLLLTLTGCVGGSPVGGVFSLPAAGHALQTAGVADGPATAAADPAATGPLAAQAFNGYVGSVEALGPLGTFEQPTALAYGPDGALFVADGSCIRRIAPDAQGRQTVSTVAGDGNTSGSVDGPVFQARFGQVQAMVGLPDGSLLLGDGTRLRRIVFDGHGGGTVTTLAGTEELADVDGSGSTARFYPIMALALGNGKVYAADANRVREIAVDPAANLATVSTYYMDGVYDPDAESTPFITQVAVTGDGSVWVDGADGSVRRLKRAADGTVAPDLVVAGTEPSERAGEPSYGRFAYVSGLAGLPSGDVMVVAGPHVRRVSVDGAGQPHVTLVAKPLPFQGPTRFWSWLMDGLSSPHHLAVGPHGELRLLDQMAVRAIDLDAAGLGTPSTLAGFPLNIKRQDGPAAATSLNPQAIVATGHGGYYIAVSNALYEMQLSEMGAATTRLLAGAPTVLGKVDGVGAQARFDMPNALAVLSDGSLIVNDYQNHRIRQVTFGADGTATVSTLAGGGNAPLQQDSLTVGDGPALTATVLANHDLLVTADDTIYFGDSDRVRKLAKDASGQWVVTSLAGRSRVGIHYKDGPGDQARFGLVAGLAMDATGALFVADSDNHLIRKLVFDAAGNAAVSTIAGKVTPSSPFETARGFKDGPADQALFEDPNDIDLASDGSLLVTDCKNCAIRRVYQDPTGAWQVRTLIGPGLGMVDGPFNQARLYYPLSLAADGPGHFLCLDGSYPTNQLRTIRLGSQP